jgi:hypothetical protein
LPCWIGVENGCLYSKKEGPILTPNSSKLGTCSRSNILLPWLTNSDSKPTFVERAWSPLQDLAHVNAQRISHLAHQPLFWKWCFVTFAVFPSRLGTCRAKIHSPWPTCLHFETGVFGQVWPPHYLKPWLISSNSKAMSWDRYTIICLISVGYHSEFHVAARTFRIYYNYLPTRLYRILRCAY